MNKTIRGFTIIEALIVAAILSLVLGSIFGIAYRAQMAFDAERRFTETSQHARIAMDEIVRYIRQAGNDPFPKDPPTIVGVHIDSSNQITVMTDITGSYDGRTGDPDKACNSPMEDVTIRYLGRKVEIKDNKTTEPFQALAENIDLPPGESSFFKFYDSAGNLLSSAADSPKVVAVAVAMAAKSPARGGSKENTVVYRSHVFVRSKAFDVFATP